MKKKTDYKSKYMVDSSIQNTINHSIIDPEIQQAKTVILDNDCDQPISNDHEIANPHLDFTIEEFEVIIVLYLPSFSKLH